MSEHAHVTSVKFYIFIGATLIALTFLTAGIAFVNLGPFNPVVALAIATLKALLVVLFFMHVKDTSERMVKVVIAGGIFFLLILLMLSLLDYTTRLLG